MKCQDLVDKHVGAFEMNDGNIQDIDCEDVTRQCFNCSSKVQSNLLCDLHMLLHLSSLLPLLEAMHALIKFAQRRDILICDFVAATKIC